MIKFLTCIKSSDDYSRDLGSIWILNEAGLYQGRRSVTRKDQRLLLLQLWVTAGMMYQHLSSFEPLYLKYDTFCEYAAMAQEEVLGSLITSITYRVTTKNDFISMVYKLLCECKGACHKQQWRCKRQWQCIFAFDNFFNLFQQCPEETNFRLYYPRVNFNVWRLSSPYSKALYGLLYKSISIKHGRPSWADFNTLINDLTQRSKCILSSIKSVKAILHNKIVCWLDWLYFLCTTQISQLNERFSHLKFLNELYWNVKGLLYFYWPSRHEPLPWAFVYLTFNF